jgi:hypothetical protein
MRAALALLALGLAVLMTSRKVYTHIHFFVPANTEFRKALRNGDLTRATYYLDKEKRYEMYGLDPFWFLDGREKE